VQSFSTTFLARNEFGAFKDNIAKRIHIAVDQNANIQKDFSKFKDEVTKRIETTIDESAAAIRKGLDTSLQARHHREKKLENRISEVESSMDCLKENKEERVRVSGLEDQLGELEEAGKQNAVAVSDARKQCEDISHTLKQKEFQLDHHSQWLSILSDI
jgi:polyhydroxyalkanoate synthesis regulator phasin